MAAAAATAANSPAHRKRIRPGRRDRRPLGPLVLVGAYCGLRLGELAGLRRGRVDLLARTIDVVEIVTAAGGRLHTRPPKTRAGPRTAAATARRRGPRGDLWLTGPEVLVFAGPRGGAVRGSAVRHRVWQPAVRAPPAGGRRPGDRPPRRASWNFVCGPAGRLRQPGAEPFGDWCQLEGIADCVDVVDEALVQSERDKGDEMTFAEPDHCHASLRR